MTKKTEHRGLKVGDLVRFTSDLKNEFGMGIIFDIVQTVPQDELFTEYVIHFPKIGESAHTYGTTLTKVTE